MDLGNGQWDIPELRQLVADVLPKSAAVVGYRVNHDFPHIGQRTFSVSARRLSHPDDNSTQMLLVFEDTTAADASKAAQDILLAETQHRMKNLVAIIRGVASQTEAKGRTGEQYRDLFLGRLDAVLKAQEIADWGTGTAELGELIRKLLAPLASHRVAVTSGPPISLSPHQVLPFTMILHELTTNALKYGALSALEGVVHITWSTEQREGQRRLVLEWREEGGPPVARPAHQGFGTELIDHSAKAEGGTAVLNFDPTGLRMRLTIPLEQ